MLLFICFCIFKSGKYCNLRYKQISSSRVSVIGSGGKVFCFAIFVQSIRHQGLSLSERAYLRYALSCFVTSHIS